MSYGYTYPQLPIYDLPPPPTYLGDDDYSYQPKDAIPMPTIKAAMTPCCREVYDSQRLYNHVRMNHACPNDGRPLHEAHLIPIPNHVNLEIKTMHKPAPQANNAHRVNNAAQQSFGIFDKLWSGVKTVIKFAVQLTVAAFSILWEIVKVLLKMVAYTALLGSIIICAANPTLVTGAAVGVLALLALALSR